GNRLKSDDAFGSIIAEKLRQNLTDTPLADRIYDAGIAPENYYGKLAKLNYNKILIIDAVVFDDEVGKLCLFTPEELSSSLVLTHGPSNFQMMKMLLPTAEILILAVRPENIKLGEPISESVAHTIKIFIDELLYILNLKFD
ncbi:hypothetical protein DRQ33_03440, partial [bacterium]